MFISWAPYCSRSDSIAAWLGGRSLMVYCAWLGSNYFTAPLKYLVQGIWTLGLLVWFRPSVVIVMAPPVVACAPVWLYAVLSGARFAIDAHSGAFLNPRWKNWQSLQRFFSRRAATTIVTGVHLRDMVLRWQADATVVPFVPVSFCRPEPVHLPSRRNMTLVASFCYDEPVAEFLQAAAGIPDVTFHVTGNDRTLPAAVRDSAPPNVRFAGFLSDPRYVGQLQASDAIIALTRLKHTMQRAAYEAIFLGRPVLTSDSELLKETFPKGAVHVAAEAESIRTGLIALRDNLVALSEEAAELRTEFIDRWQHTMLELQRVLALSLPQEQDPQTQGSTVESRS